MQGLFSLAYDDSPAVKRAVCAGLVQLLALAPDRLEAHMVDVMEYMLKATQVRGAYPRAVAAASQSTRMRAPRRFIHLAIKRRTRASCWKGASPGSVLQHAINLESLNLNHLQDADEGVALESCEFWAAFCEAQLDPALLRPALPRLVPVLLRNMVYDEYDEEVRGLCL